MEYEYEYEELQAAVGEAGGMVLYVAMVATAATVRTTAATRKQLETSEAEAGWSFGAPATTGVRCVRGRQAIYRLSTMVLAAKPCEHIAAAAAMTHNGTDGSIELLDSWWRLFNSITPLLPVDCGTCPEENKAINNVSEES